VATVASIRVVKEFTYRGVLRQYSNRYSFNNGTPSTGALWTILSDAIVTAEKAIHTTVASGGSRILHTYGYAAGSDVPVFDHAYTTDGTLALTGYAPVPGDVAGLIRYATANRSSKNHPIYLYNYYHGVGNSGVFATKDTLLASQASAMATYGAAWVTGFSDGATTYHRCSPSGHLATGVLVEPLLTHRDLPR
jgi:hypothetical protein